MTDTDEWPDALIAWNKEQADYYFGTELRDMHCQTAAALEAAKGLRADLKSAMDERQTLTDEICAWQTKCETAESEVERLREALTKIRDKWARRGDEDWLIADAALEGEDHELQAQEAQDTGPGQ